MRLAILGGSFNPVHEGHLSLAKDVHETLGYDRILMIPANIPPHREMAERATARDRYEMLILATSGYGYISVSDCELNRGGVSYTIDTLRSLREEYAGVLEGKIGMIIGQDLADGFATWKNADDIAAEFDIILANRPGSGDASFPYRHKRIDNSPVDASSTGIRDAMRSGCDWSYLVPPAVYRYIVEHKLYER